MTNFPGSKKVDKAFVLDLVRKIAPNAVLNRLELYEAERASAPSFELRGRTSEVAYAIVDFEFDQHLKAVRRALRKTWLDDRLLKVKTLKDRELESHDNRTMVLEKIPKNFTAEELLNTMS